MFLYWKKKIYINKEFCILKMLQCDSSFILLSYYSVYHFDYFTGKNSNIQFKL